MDNAKYHTSTETKTYLESQPFSTYFIPAYAPSLAPIELYFGNLKAKVNKMIIEMFLEDEDQSELDVLVRSIRAIDGDAIKRIWRTFTGKIKQDLGIINDNQSF